MVESHIDASIRASETLERGGESRITYSKYCGRTPRNCLNRLAMINSPGLGGTGPQGRTNRFGIAVSWIADFSSAEPARIADSPVVLVKSKIELIRGLRMSPSISRTRAPV